jgi:hypothetical protein
MKTITPMSLYSIEKLDDKEKIKILIAEYNTIAEKFEQKYGYYDKTAEAFYRASANLKIQLRHLEE